MSKQRLVGMVFVLSIGLAVLAWSMLAPIAPPVLPDGSSVVSSPQQETPAGMVWIPGGKFLMGSRDGKADEQPIHEVELDGFWMDTTEVTNREFLRFTEATGYRTVAERVPKREDFVGLTPEQAAAIKDEDLVPGSICFNPNFDRDLVRALRQNPNIVDWPNAVWIISKGASWRHPRGPESSLDDLLDHPVVHVCWEDAVAYCEWSGKRLPTEAEFEFASRGGKNATVYPWGDELLPDKKWLANLWQGEFPYEHNVADGHEFTAPVKSYPANGFGLFDISGNVWEWCSDWYQPDYYSDSPRRNPTGPRDSFDPNEPTIPKRVQRGGSFMCNDNYCLGYRCATRMKGEPSSSSFHCGFRCVLSSSSYEQFQKAPAQADHAK